MSLRKKAQTIEKSHIRSGQVLEITYDGKTAMVLVIDPNATSVSNTGAKDSGVGQGRANKLHAIKLENFVEEDLINLVKEIRSVGQTTGVVTEYEPSKLYEKFINSKYAGRRTYRTYNIEKIDSKVKRITVGQDAPGSNKIELNGSILYGVVHGSYVEIAFSDYDLFAQQLLNNKYKTFYEGPEGHEEVTKELMQVTISEIVTGKSWEPSPEEFNKIAIELSDTEGLGKLGGNVAGWWNQWIRGDTDGGKVATNNIKSVWKSTGVSFDGTIRDAFERSVGNLSLIEAKWKTYIYEGKTYDWNYVSNLLSQRGWDSKGKPTQALIEFNEAGHFQVFPEDSAWNMETKKLEGNYEEGELFEAQSTFNKIRDIHLINLMKTQRGIYFAGSGHLNNVRNLLNGK